jgi:hypothetical protein
MVVDIMMEVLSSLALATKGLKRGQTSESIFTGVFLTQLCTARFVKKRFEEKEVEAVLQRLDRLTQDEARTKTAEILTVVHGLVQNMNAAIDGEKTRLTCAHHLLSTLLFRRQAIYRRYPKSTRYVFLVATSQSFI